MADRYTPFDEMSRMFDQMDRTMRHMRRAMYGNGPRFAWDVSHDAPALEGRTHNHGEFRMGSNLSLERSDDGYVVYADTPGFDRDEIDLTFDSGVLRIRATHEVSDEHSSRSRTVDEQITVPGEIDVDAIAASYRNGVLEVTLPTLEAVSDETHHIDID